MSTFSPVHLPKLSQNLPYIEKSRFQSFKNWFVSLVAIQSFSYSHFNFNEKICHVIPDNNNPKTDAPHFLQQRRCSVSLCLGFNITIPYDAIQHFTKRWAYQLMTCWTCPPHVRRRSLTSQPEERAEENRAVGRNSMGNANCSWRPKSLRYVEYILQSVWTITN